jgi:hypothetical protein
MSSWGTPKSSESGDECSISSRVADGQQTYIFEINMNRDIFLKFLFLTNMFIKFWPHRKRHEQMTDRSPSSSWTFKGASVEEIQMFLSYIMYPIFHKQ